MRNFFVILFCALFFAPGVFAQPEFATTQSYSKQFVVYGPKGSPRSSKAKSIGLDPALLTVSCDRIKQTLLAELYGGERTQFKLQHPGEGKIYVVLHPGTRQSPLITPINSTTLSYRVDLPNEIEGARLLETITETLLLEMVNRHAENFTQVPRWLAQGIAERVKLAAPETLLLQGNRPISHEKVQQDVIARIRKNLATYTPLTFQELSWPENLPAEKTRHYEECSHLFLHELARLKNGRECLAKLVEELPRHLNWQVAFLRAFQPHFPQLIDVEKWWSLKIVNSSGRGTFRLWSREQSLERLDAAVSVGVQEFSASANPNHGSLSLQEVISKWEPTPQKTALTKVIHQLRGLRLRLQPEFLKAADEYIAILENYLQAEEKSRVLKFLMFQNNSEGVKQSTFERLAALDGQRTIWRSLPKPVTRDEAMRAALESADKEGSGKR